MQTFKTKAFARFADREGLEDAALCEAVRRAGEGLVDADLGGGVIKQRIARKGGGRSGGFRTIVLFRRGALAFFVYGFAKSGRGQSAPGRARDPTGCWPKGIWRWTKRVSRRRRPLEQSSR